MIKFNPKVCTTWATCNMLWLYSAECPWQNIFKLAKREVHINYARTFMSRAMCHRNCNVPIKVVGCSATTTTTVLREGKRRDVCCVCVWVFAMCSAYPHNLYLVSQHSDTTTSHRHIYQHIQSVYVVLCHTHGTVPFCARLDFWGVPCVVLRCCCVVYGCWCGPTSLWHILAYKFLIKRTLCCAHCCGSRCRASRATGKTCIRMWTCAPWDIELHRNTHSRDTSYGWILTGLPLYLGERNYNTNIST